MRKGEFSEKLQETLICIKNCLSTSINFEGNAPGLLIDELQFLLNPGCVIIESPSESFANILPDERRVVEKCTEGFPWKQDAGNAGIQFNHKNFPPIGELYTGNVPLLTRLHKVTDAFTFELQLNQNQWKVAIYCNPSNMSARFWEVPEFFRFISEALKIVSAANNPYMELHDKLRRLSSDFEESDYLEIVFRSLRDRIAEHLAKENEKFITFAKNPFFIQFFIRCPPAVAAFGSENKKPSLRFFALKNQKTELNNPDIVKRIKENLKSKHLLPPPDVAKFITRDYLWDSNNAFVGYSYDTASSLYLEDWQNEPRASGIHLSPDEKEKREIATTIMQSLRDETPHLFIFPLYANKETIGAVVINCPEDIEPSTRIGPVRTSRELGFLISIAINTDDVVNHLKEEKAKAAQVQSYKHATQYVMHDERAYCRLIQVFLAELRTKYPVDSDPAIGKYIDLISYIVEDKSQLVDEFASNDNPLHYVPEGIIYPSRRAEPESSNISLDRVKEIIIQLQELFDTKKLFRPVILNFGDRLRELEMIPNLDEHILSRIFANLIKNSIAQAKSKNLKNGSLNFHLELIANDMGEYLQIKATDNCGGFNDPQIPDKITTDNWLEYMNKKYLDKGIAMRGIGFLTFCKYVQSTGGQFLKKNIADPEAGAQIILTIGLKK